MLKDEVDSLVNDVKELGEENLGLFEELQDTKARLRRVRIHLERLHIKAARINGESKITYICLECGAGAERIESIKHRDLCIISDAKGAK